MAFNVKRLPGEPIIVVEVTPPFERGGVDDVNEQVHALAQEISGPVFRISDVRAIDPTFQSIQETLAEHQDQEPGSITDPKFLPVFVGGGKLSEILAKGFEYEVYGGVRVQIFDSMEIALETIRRQIDAWNT